MATQKIQLNQVQDLLIDFQNWFEDYIVNHENLFALGILLGLAFLLKLLLTFGHEKITRRLQKWLLGTTLKNLAPRAGELTFLSLLTLSLWIVDLALKLSLQNLYLMQVFRDLTTALLLIRVSVILVKRSFSIAVIAIGIGAFVLLEIIGILEETMAFLGGISFNIIGVEISLYLIFSTIVVVAVMDFILSAIRDKILAKVEHSQLVNPSQKVLVRKSLNIALVAILIFVALGSLGFSFTTLAVFTGAVGLGIGLGLQKIILNMLSGFLILMDRSIKPGDVIAIGKSFGWVNSLGSRYISVITRDGIEHLIPNEKFISDPVENWSHSSSTLRIKVDIGVSYDSDLELVERLIVDATKGFDRILDRPAPTCLLKEFADSSVDFQLRFWINDPTNGIANIRSDVMKKIWKSFAEHQIVIPFPQRDVHLVHQDSASKSKGASN